MRYQFRRIESRVLFGFILAMIPVILHITVVVIPASLNVDGDINTTAITEWLGFSQHLKFVYVYYLILPFVCSLGVNQLVMADYQSGFINHIIFRRSIKSYWMANQLMSFLSGFLIAAIPVTLDLLATSTFLPTLTPDWMISRVVTLPRLTYFYELYYTQPLLLIFIYIFMSGVLGGLYASISVTASLFTRKTILAATLPFILCLILAFLATLNSEYFFDPTTVTIAYSPDYLPPLSRLVEVSLIVMTVVYLLGMWRIRKIAKS